MTYDYFYGQQAEMFAFYRVPKVLFTEDCFWNVSTDAKLLYPDLFNRAATLEENAMPYLKTVKGLGRSYSWKEQFGKE